MQNCILIENKIIVSDSTLKGNLVSKGFGESKGRELVLDLYEGLFLLTKGKIDIFQNDSKVNGKDILKIGIKNDKNFYSKSLVYSDIKEKGFVIKTGFKFGFDYRIYPKTKSSTRVHSEFGLNVYNESEKLSMSQISNLTRLASNIKINFVAAVIDNENEINYYSLNRKLF